MQTTGLFTCPRENFIIPARLGRPVYFVPFGDIHFDSPLHVEHRFDEFLKWAKDTPDAYFLGMGDYIDFVSARGRVSLTRLKAQVKTEMHENNAEDVIKAVENQADGHISRFATKLIKAGMKGRLIGLLDGNHDFPFSDGTNTTQRLCRLLDCRYLGVCSYIGLTIQADNARRNLDIWAHHGRGSARLPGGSINNVVQMSHDAEADFYCMGHDHKRSATPGQTGKRVWTKNGYVFRHREKYYIRTGAFTKAYEDGVRAYPVDAAMPLNQIGVCKIAITMKRHERHGKEREAVLHMEAIV